MFACLHAPGNAPLLVECARNFSPLIEETSADTVVFDIHGLGLIYGALEHIGMEIQRQVGLPANIALASNPDAAVHAARGFRGLTVIPPGEEAAILAPLPLYLLGGSPEFAAAMEAWGIRTFGQLAALPPIGIAARLGDEGLDLAAPRARGRRPAVAAYCGAARISRGDGGGESGRAARTAAVSAFADAPYAVRPFARAFAGDE